MSVEVSRFMLTVWWSTRWRHETLWASDVVRPPTPHDAVTHTARMCGLLPHQRNEGCLLPVHRVPVLSGTRKFLEFRKLQDATGKWYMRINATKMSTGGTCSCSTRPLLRAKIPKKWWIQIWLKRFHWDLMADDVYKTDDFQQGIQWKNKM